MEIYLIRHTTPDVAKGVCYGQYDLAVTGSFDEEVQAIKEHLPASFDAVYSSPLRRCRQLAERLFPDAAICFDNRLKEINCGEWELLPWDSIGQEKLAAWMGDFVNASIPGGESYQELYDRVVEFFTSLPAGDRIAIVSHGGVMRSLLSFITGTALLQSFELFKLHYGCVVRLYREEGAFMHHILHNRQTTIEQHRPT